MLLALTLVTSAASCNVATEPLRVGDAAPPIEVEHWIDTATLPPAWTTEAGFTPKGEGLTVIECWATWCGPCIAGFPKLSKLQADFATQGLKVIALTKESESTCTRFMTRKTNEGGTFADRMEFAVAADPDASVWNDYLVASGRESIPRAFLINNEGVIEWIGHPVVNDLHGTVEAVLAGTWDRASYRAEFEKSQSTEFNFEIALESENWEAAERLARGNWWFLTRTAFGILLSSNGSDPDMNARAERIAVEAERVSEGTEGYVYHVLAAASAGRADYAQAVERQRRAIELDDGRGADWYNSALQKYQSKLEAQSDG